MDDDQSSHQFDDKGVVAAVKWRSVHGVNQYASIADGRIMWRKMCGDISPVLSTGTFSRLLISNVRCKDTIAVLRLITSVNRANYNLSDISWLFSLPTHVCKDV